MPPSPPLPAVLTHNSYGKSRIRMLKVTRPAGRPHEVREITVAIALEGDFAAAHAEGDNRAVLPTDTMKNTVYALGKDHPVHTIESFALDLARHFITTHAPASRARVTISEQPWEHVPVGGKPHPHTFQRTGVETRACTAVIERTGAPAGRETIESGLEGLVLLKTADSAFRGFPRDSFTTLKETDDRILATSMTAAWGFAAAADFAATRSDIRAALVSAFAAHKSESVQQTLYAIAQAALAACPLVDWIRLSLPNKHYLLVDLAHFGLENDNQVFLPIDEPHGLIEATLRRGQ
jgi:urate oxidase